MLAGFNLYAETYNHVAANRIGKTGGWSLLGYNKFLSRIIDISLIPKFRRGYLMGMNQSYNCRCTFKIVPLSLINDAS